MIDPNSPQDLFSEPETTPKRSAWSSFFHEVLETVLPAVAIVLAINLFLAQPRTVHGESMEPNLHEDERLIIELISYKFRSPERGEIIVLDVPERLSGPPLIKRVIGLPGETVEITGGAILIDGVRLDEPYLDQVTAGAMPAQLVPEEHVFVLGDNRCCSNDSRYFGMVPYEDIIGHAWLRYWPPQDVGLFE